MEINSTSLFVANAMILAIMAGVFLTAGRRAHRAEPYWMSWFGANMVLALALVMFVLERHLSPLFVAMLPNTLLVIGFGLRWRAAREFGSRPAPWHLVWAPGVFFACLCLVPWFSGTYGPVYTIVNLVLAALSFAVAWEFWRDRDDGLPSRIGLVVSYGAMGSSFAFRIGQGLLQGPQMGHFLPQDTLLVIHLLIAVFHTVSSGGFALSLAYERYAGELRHTAAHDFLSGLLNRGAFETRLVRLIGRREAPIALALFDIDHFKDINDRHGHAAGDAALRTCASLIRDSLRDEDFVGRVGGEEFAVVLTNVTPRDARRIVDRIRRSVAALELNLGGHPTHITISAGICHAPAERAQVETMMRTADAMLYAAKGNGRNRLECAA
ncbi:GGDEF domain-containing protein [Pararhizobium haloflavum]|uniref:GGDEF domain-containing protein n=1 Tax=Pararhizobium haloflavum TaxID=2037914 RepID=UPI000C174091|nr:GGDEF domain-containing protein [Pararhizobium haloflavum]